MPAYDYSVVAEIYDDFCVFDADIEFFQQRVRDCDGLVLELMAGTGRVSVPMLESGTRLCCVDSSPAMLSVLNRKLRARRLHAGVLCGDVCDLPLGSQFELVVLPFQGFTEIVDRDDQRRLLDEVRRVLSTSGRFICTSHNPEARGATIDGNWHEIGRFHNQSGGTLVLHLKTWFSNRTGVVEGIQRIEVYDQHNRLENELKIDLEFSLTPPREIVAMAESAGLKTVALIGDYQGTLFEEGSSPCFVGVFERQV